MNRELRKEKLIKLKQNTTKPYMTGIHIKYKGQMQAFDAYKIPLDYLIYNKYNGRIGTLVKSFEQQYYTINAEKEKDKKIIEDFLWESKKDRNKITEKSLANDGQMKYGIVTHNGVIIDGNRRASILNRIYRDRNSKWKDKDVSHAQYFIAVILPQDVEEKEIHELETSYQMGVDEKLDYNPIEKYLKCKDLLNFDFTEKDIANMMGEKDSQIRKWISTLELMENYLEYYEYKGIYTRLEKREDQFLNLNAYLNKYRNNRVRCNWAPDEDDIDDVKLICFDYIRAMYEGKDFRNICNTSQDEASSIFRNEEIWKDFCIKHFEIIDGIEEKSVEELRSDNPDTDVSKLLQKRDDDWKVRVNGNLRGNLNKSVRKIENKQEANQPAKLLQKALDTLQSINVEVETFYTDSEVERLVKEIGKQTWEFKKMIEKKGK